MSTRSALAQLRRKKQVIERAIRALEQLERLEDGDSVRHEGQPHRRTGTSNVVEIPRRRRRN